jgi:hypothetical protein
MKQAHQITGNSAKELRKHLRDVYHLEEGEDIFYLAQVLAFLVHDTPVEKLSASVKLQRNRFAIRKLRAVLDLLDKVFTL